VKRPSEYRYSSAFPGFKLDRWGAGPGLH
jgi:hypothetical protein